MHSCCPYAFQTSQPQAVIAVQAIARYREYKSIEHPGQLDVNQVNVNAISNQVGRFLNWQGNSTCAPALPPPAPPAAPSPWPAPPPWPSASPPRSASRASSPPARASSAPSRAPPRWRHPPRPPVRPNRGGTRGGGGPEHVMGPHYEVCTNRLAHCSHNSQFDKGNGREKGRGLALHHVCTVSPILVQEPNCPKVGRAYYRTAKTTKFIALLSYQL